MTLESKYDLGDEIYYIDGWSIIRASIEKIDMGIARYTELSDKGCVDKTARCVKYWLGNQRPSVSREHWVNEEDIYTNKEDAKDVFRKRVEEL